MLLNPHTSQLYVNTGNTSRSNNSNDKSTDRRNLRILESKAYYAILPWVICLLIFLQKDPLWLNIVHK